jgi:hypothetical protein
MSLTIRAAYEGMRVWDIHPGYLNRESLLGEHREVHAVFSIITNHKLGYARHPETLRWRDCLGALVLRHDCLVEEMRFRGFRHLSPAPDIPGSPWPQVFMDPPAEQFSILERKYRMKHPGRITLPMNAQQLWAHHKYSVMARDARLYIGIGPEVARRKGRDYFQGLALSLVGSLRIDPGPGCLLNALQHMWGYVSSPGNETNSPPGDVKGLIAEIQRRSLLYHVNYLLESTALTDLAFWAHRQGKEDMNPDIAIKKNKN